MSAYLLPWDRLEELVGRLLKAAEVIAPRRLESGDVFYGAIASPAEVAWDYRSAVEPLKRFLLPQREPILRFSTNGKLQVEPIYDEKDRVFLGVRSCDVSGVGVLDAMFGGDIEDPYYMARRRRATFIALTCQEPDEHCFCVCGDGGPFLKKGYDQQWTALGEGMLVEVGSEKGQALADSHSDLLSQAEPSHIGERLRLAKEAETRFGDFHSYIAAAMRKLSMAEVPEEVWEKGADHCVECGGCTFLCPTCSCFTVTDRREGDVVLRERHWDACMYSCYSREASGHNPRATRAQRVRGRFFHKLSLQWAQRNGRHGCVGCGRCVATCEAWGHMAAVSEAIRRGWESE